jgi:anti-anti-sigma factor
VRELIIAPVVLDAGNRGEFKDRVMQALGNRGCDRVEVDMLATESVDSAGLGVLVTLSKMAARERKGALVLRNVHGILRTYLEVTHLDSLFVMEG